MISRKWYPAIHLRRVRRPVQVAHARRVQRLFSMFPRGLPGLALLFLRASAAISLLFNCYAHRGDLSGWILLAAVLISLALFAGFLTPIVAMAGLLFHGLIWVNADAVRIIAVVIVSLDAVALAMLGPGAYSIDGYTFGRRVVVIPPL